MGVDAQMLIKYPGKISKEKCLEIAINTFERFGSDNLFVSRLGEKRHCVTLCDIFYQDGPDITPKEGETFLEVHLWGRYYGEGYERGDLPSIIMIAAWFEAILSGCEVWYGGDSSGICAELFDLTAREKAFKYFVEHGHRPYTSYFDHDNDGPECDICQIKMTRFGWGGNYKAWYCHGCGHEAHERDGILTFGKEKS